MPKYTYFCRLCNDLFEYWHSMEYEMDHCILCESDDKENIQRMPAGFTIPKKNTSSNKKPGDVVKKFIEEAKEEVNQEKKELRKKNY